MEDNKQKALNFLNMVVAGKIEAAYKKYVDMNGKHHNTYYAQGFQVLKKAMEESHIKFPDKKFSIKHVLQDDDLVAVHSHVVLSKDLEVAVVHLFKFNKGKIVEMWDIGQQLPKNIPNEDGAF